MTHPRLKDAHGRPIEPGERIGLYGGTFDPVHNGHLAAAVRVTEAFSLDSLLFIPAMYPPHKKKIAITPFEHRAAMLQIAVAGRPGFFVSAIESERKGLSYTVDTLTRLRRRLGDGVDLFFVIGMDMFADIGTWKEFERIPELSDLVVIERPAHDRELMQEMMGLYFFDYTFEPVQNAWVGKGNKGRIHPLSMEPVPISSTRVRQMYRSGRSIRDLVPSGVEEYMNRFRNVFA